MRFGDHRFKFSDIEELIIDRSRFEIVGKHEMCLTLSIAGLEEQDEDIRVDVVVSDVESHL
jgi:hypothetical protein